MPASGSLRGQGRAPARLVQGAWPFPRPPGHIYSLCRIHFLQALQWHRRKEMETKTTTRIMTIQKSTGPGTQRRPCTLHPDAGRGGVPRSPPSRCARGPAATTWDGPHGPRLCSPSPGTHAMEAGRTRSFPERGLKPRPYISLAPGPYRPAFPHLALGSPSGELNS